MACHDQPDTTRPNRNRSSSPGKGGGGQGAAARITPETASRGGAGMPRQEGSSTGSRKPRNQAQDGDKSNVVGETRETTTKDQKRRHMQRSAARSRRKSVKGHPAGRWPFFVLPAGFMASGCGGAVRGRHWRGRAPVSSLAIFVIVLAALETSRGRGACPRDTFGRGSFGPSSPPNRYCRSAPAGAKSGSKIHRSHPLLGRGGRVATQLEPVQIIGRHLGTPFPVAFWWRPRTTSAAATLGDAPTDSGAKRQADAGMHKAVQRRGSGRAGPDRDLYDGRSDCRRAPRPAG